MYWHSYFNINDFDENADYAVFDDIAGGFQFFPNYKGWLGAQKTFTVTDKYRAKKRIDWGKPCIMLMNEDPTIIPTLTPLGYLGTVTLFLYQTTNQ